MFPLNRREMMSLAGSTLALASFARPQGLPADESPKGGCTLGFSTYAVPQGPLEETLPRIRDIGYDSVEMTVTPDRDASPDNMSNVRRKAIAAQLKSLGLRLTSLMEHLPIATDDAGHRKQLDRLRRSAELGHDLCPERPPVIQTVLGGRDWQRSRDLFRDRLADWQEIARQTHTIVCIKPHRGAAASRPKDAVWLIEQLGNSPWLRMCYDYSHFAFRDMPLADTIRTALPFTAHIAVKDAVKDQGKIHFEIPGAAQTIDYVTLLKLFYRGGYRRDICVEVSSQVWKQPNYDATQAMRKSYQAMSAAFDQAGVPRP